MVKFTKNRQFGEQYIRYLISYIMVLLIPLIILTLLYSSSFMKKFYEEIYETVDLELSQTSTRMENELDSMQNIVVQLTLSGAIPTAVTANTLLDFVPVISTLSGFTAANSFVEDIILLINDEEYLITSTSTSKPELYFDRILQIPALKTAEKQEQLLRSQIPVCLPLLRRTGNELYAAEENVILFSYPLFTDYQKYEGNALFYVRTAAVQNFISDKLQSYQSQIYILDQSGNIIFSDGPNDSMREILPSFLTDSHSGGFKTMVEHKEYLVRSYQSETNGWHYFALIPDKQNTFTQVSSIMNEFIMAIVFIMVLASFTIYILQRVNYAPMRRLRDKAKEISPEQMSKNEFETIDRALDYLSTQNTSLSTRLADSQTAVLNERLYRLISGSYVSREDFNLDCSELELTLPYDYFTVLIFHIHTPDVRMEELAHSLKDQFANLHVYYCLNSFSPNQIVFLLNLSEQGQHMEKQLYAVHTYAAQTLGVLITTGIGSCVDNTADIALSYMEAASALDYRFVKGNGTMIDIREVLDPARINIFYPNQEFEALRNALLSQNEGHIRAAINIIIEFTEQNQLPLYLARSICFNLIHMVNEHCRGQKQADSNSPLELTGMETAQDIIWKLRTWSESLDGLTSQTVLRVDIGDVLRYLDEHCLSCDFSAYETAERFDMTLPAFSKFFKDNTGQNVMDYTISKRIGAARLLLKTTALPLKEIAEQVGYYNLSSFTRRFKLHQGITPSEYRKLCNTT